MDILLIGIGSAIGGILRYLISISFYKLLGKAFPYGTLVVNVLGCFLIGLLFIVLINKLNDFTNHLRAFLLIGFLGGFTTFSSFSLETINLFEVGRPFLAFINIICSIVLCISLTWIGMLIANELL